MHRVLIDTGPLVAILRADDTLHQVAVTQGELLPGPFLTSWAVLAEAAWLLRSVGGGLDRLLELIQKRLLEPIDIPADAIPALRARAAAYRDLRPQLADLTLCWMAEQDVASVIFTFDRRDFLTYRASSGKPFSIVPQ